MQCFSKHGFSASTTREIAHVAGVNEVSLFRNFPSKQDLFWASLQSRLDQLRLPKGLQEHLSEGSKPELVVPIIAELLVKIATDQPELIQLMFVGLRELRPNTERAYQEYVAPLLKSINSYVECCVANGEMRNVDPTMATVAFITSILTHRSLYPLLSNLGVPHENTQEAVSAYSNFWLDALVPPAIVRGNPLGNPEDTSCCI